MFRATFALVFSLAIAGVVAAQNRDIGEIQIKADLKTKAVRIAGSPELVPLAQTAFKAHGAFRVSGADAAYVLTFTAVGGNQVRIDVSTGNPARSVFSQVASGHSQRNALLRAADLAVEQITGMRGFFGGKITFISEKTGKREVYTADLFFGDVLQITHDKADALSPRWSPDGTRIVYTSFFRSGSPDIYVMNLRTNQRTTFASFKGTNSGARFSPNGTQIAAVLSAGGNQEVFVANAAGTGFRRVTNSPGVEASPVWSPDGSRLLFTSDREGRPQLYLASVGGGAMTRVPTNLSGYCAEPDWSAAKPNMIAFTVAQGPAFEVAVYDFNTRQGSIVTKGAGDGVEPCWLADGRHLIYTARSAGVRRLMLLDTESGKATQLSPAGMGQVSQGNYVYR